jgi:hypothetical protein
MELSMKLKASYKWHSYYHIKKNKSGKPTFSPRLATLVSDVSCFKRGDVDVNHISCASNFHSWI